MRGWDPRQMEEVARLVWPGHADEIYASSTGICTGRGHLLLHVDHPRASEAIAAALSVLNDDERTPPGLHDLCTERLERLHQSVEVLRNKYKTEVQKRELLKGQLIACSLRWEEEAPQQASFLKHLIAHEF